MEHIRFLSPRELLKKYPFLRETDTMFLESRAKILCEIDPKEFLHLASPLGDYEFNRPYTHELIQVVAETLWNKDEWEYNDAHHLFYGMFLTLDIDYLKISGHEGRHRALGFIAAGYDYMPLVINLMGRNPISEGRQSLSYYDFPANMTKQFKENIKSYLSEKEIFPEWDRQKEAISLYTKLGVCKRCRAKPHLSTCTMYKIENIQNGEAEK